MNLRIIVFVQAISIILLCLICASAIGRITRLEQAAKAQGLINQSQVHLRN